MQGDPHVRFDEQGVETGCLVSPTGEPHDTAPPPDSTLLAIKRLRCVAMVADHGPDQQAGYFETRFSCA